MRLVAFLLGLAILCLVATQLSFGIQQQVVIKRKDSEEVEKKDLAISDALGLSEQEKELEQEILSSRVLEPVVEVEDIKKAKKAKKLKKMRQKKKLAQRRLAMKRKAAQQRKAEQRKRQKAREEAREQARRGYIRKKGDAKCFDALEQYPNMSRSNCSQFKTRGFCDHKIPFLKSRMMEYCRKTCEFCVAAAPPIRRSCDNTEFGCCWDRDVPAKGPNYEGCAPCVNRYIQLCQQFRDKCDDMTESGAWVRRHCPAKCRVCEQSPEMKEQQRKKNSKVIKNKLVSSQIKERYRRKEEQKAQKKAQQLAKKKNANKKKRRPRNGAS